MFNPYPNTIGFPLRQGTRGTVQNQGDIDVNILIVGAGAIGSLYGALLSKRNTVVLVGRTPHMTAIQHEGLTIKGKTQIHVSIPAVETFDKIQISPDLILITVKSYDTEVACRQILPYVHDDTMVMTLQNGLDNIEKMGQYIKKSHILAGVTMNGALISKPGEIHHTGKGETILGTTDGRWSPQLETIVNIFKDAGIQTRISDDIVREIWMKAIINSSINPITAFLGCKNGYLLENPILKNIVEQVCHESTTIAASEGISVTPTEMIEKTIRVIRDTAQNYSSMVQSVRQGKKTEIDSINGALMRSGIKHDIDVALNKILMELIMSLQMC